MNLRLAQLSTAETQTLMTMLSCVVDQADEYTNEVHFFGGDGVVRFAIERETSPGSSPPPDLIGSRSFIAKLESAGLIEVLPPPPARIDRRGRVRGGQANAFYFTPQALELYHRREVVEDAEVRRAIGQYLYEHYRQHPDEFVPFDVGAVARRINVAPDRVSEQTRLLRDVGILNDVGPLNSAVEFGFLQLSHEGLRWAVRGFTDDLFTGPTLNVAVHVNIHHVVQEIQEAPVSDAVKDQATELVKEIQDEPTIEKVSRLVGLAANAQQLAPAVVRFISDNGQALIQHLPGG